MRMARKTHGTGTVARHRRKEVKDLLEHKKYRDKQLLKKFMHKQRKKNKRTVKIVKAITKPEILEQWARKERLTAKKQLRERKIRQFTFYCKMLAIDALYLKHMPKREIRIQKDIVFRPSKKGVLSEQQKKDMIEKLSEMETKTFNRKKLVKRQMEKLKKGLPKVA